MTLPFKPDLDKVNQQAKLPESFSSKDTVHTQTHSNTGSLSENI